MLMAGIEDKQRSHKLLARMITYEENTFRIFSGHESVWILHKNAMRWIHCSIAMINQTFEWILVSG